MSVILGLKQTISCQNLYFWVTSNLSQNIFTFSYEGSQTQIMWKPSSTLLINSAGQESSLSSGSSTYFLLLLFYSVTWTTERPVADPIDLLPTYLPDEPG